MKKYVWLNLNTGEFSNSWNEEAQNQFGKSLIEDGKEASDKGWKLIEYSCLNDGEFNFYHRMKIVTNNH